MDDWTCYVDDICCAFVFYICLFYILLYVLLLLVTLSFSRVTLTSLQMTWSVSLYHITL